MNHQPAIRPSSQEEIPDPSQLGDSIHWQDAGPHAAERVVRPALAVLFRLAIGPGADHYAQRFLAFESGRRGPGWHWPSLFFPAAWAFYRRLWVSGVAFALLPLAGAMTFVAWGPEFDDGALPWLAALAISVWLVPGSIAALAANRLLYGRIRRLVRQAEAGTRSATKVAARVNACARTSPLAATLLGGGALALALLAVGPEVREAYAEHGVRVQVAATLAAVRALQDQVVDTWSTSRLVPSQTGSEALRGQAGARHIEAAEVSPLNGRVRLVLAPTLPEIAGKAILLAPALDDAQRVRWFCIPVDIPSKYLPAECRQR